MTKQDILKALEDLPEDASIEDAIERLYLMFKIEQGLEQVRAGQGISHEAAKARFDKWLKWHP
jgi:hypothetical protein